LSRRRDFPIVIGINFSSITSVKTKTASINETVFLLSRRRDFPIVIGINFSSQNLSKKQKPLRKRNGFFIEPAEGLEPTTC
jgi:hypothetical protein